MNINLYTNLKYENTMKLYNYINNNNIFYYFRKITFKIIIIKYHLQLYY